MRLCRTCSSSTFHPRASVPKAAPMGRMDPHVISAAGKGFGPVTKPKPPKNPKKRDSLFKVPKKKDRINADEFERLMLDWDDVFVHLCEVPEHAQKIYEVASGGYDGQGRGLVYLTASVSKKSATPTTSEPGSVQVFGDSRMVLDSWQARFVPASLLVEGNVGGLQLGPQGISLPTAASLVETAPRGKNSQKSPEATVLDELRSVMRGMDTTRLYTLVGCQGAEESAEQPYEHSAEELVVLLHAKVDGVPATGADIVRRRVRDDGNTMELIMPALDGM